METGKKLFTSNCAMCHTLTKDDLIGPGLAGVNERREQAWLISWIKNSQKMVESKDKIAVELFNKYNKVVMPPYDYSDEEIKSILSYIDAEEKL
jgi:mono/diheme cytochrome c family protein